MLREFKFFVLVLLLICFGQLHAQRFFGAVTLGINASQIDGDNAAGYHKPGLTGGIKVDYPVNEAVDISTELLYSSRGSRSNRDDIRIDLDYIEIPVLISFRDWYIEKDKYDKVRVDGGISYGYLFRSASNENTIGPYIDQLKKHDVSLIVGAGYMFSANWGLSLRYTRSLYKMLSGENFERGGLLGYFVTLRGEYHF
ncbi:MAG: PorT family protein [Saprospiraceae bacterium]|nr:PorT family protein [Saprospiraceae bacterium]